MRRSLIFFVIVAAAVISAEELETRKTVKKSAPNENELEARTEEPEEMTIKVEVVKETTTKAAVTSSTTASPTIIASTTEKIEEISASTSEKLPETSEKLPETSSTTEVSSNESVESSIDEDDNDNSSPEIINIVPTKDPQKRKVVFINQRQNGKLNVHLELSDVSVIVIPKNKDPQLSLLNLLFKSAQKSSMAKKKEEEMKVEVHHHDEYSKYKPSLRPADDTFHHLGSTGMPPFIESRAPYRVDISSTLGQQSPAVEITSHSQQIARSPIMQLLKPIPYTIQNQNAPGQSNRIFKRSIDSRLLGIDDEIPSDEDELTESIFNSLDKKEEFNGIDRVDGSEFVLLGATENCGPGRRRNSYQICVAVDYE